MTYSTESTLLFFVHFFSLHESVFLAIKAVLMAAAEAVAAEAMAAAAEAFNIIPTAITVSKKKWSYSLYYVHNF